MSENQPEPLLLDTALEVAVQADDEAKLVNELRTLRVAAIGLRALAHQVAKAESPDPAVKSFMQTSTPNPLVVNCFWWYSVSLCNFLRLTGWIAGEIGAAHPSGKLIEPQDIESAFSAVKAYRDKIGAHFVQHKRNRRDNEAEKLASVVTALSMINGRWVAGAGVIGLASPSTGTVSSKAIGQWGLTDTHAQVVERFPWPFSEAELKRGISLKTLPEAGASITLHVPKPLGPAGPTHGEQKQGESEEHKS